MISFIHGLISSISMIKSSVHINIPTIFQTVLHEWMNEWTDTSLRYRHWRMCFEQLLQAFARWQPGNLSDIAAQPILEYRELVVIHNCPCEHSSKLQLSIRFTPSRCLDVRQDWYPMYYPEWKQFFSFVSSQHYWDHITTVLLIWYRNFIDDNFYFYLILL